MDNQAKEEADFVQLIEHNDDNAKKASYVTQISSNLSRASNDDLND
jgi:hypothetical protein